MSKSLLRILTKAGSTWPSQCSLSKFGTSCPVAIDQKWRAEKKLPSNPNAYGVLTDGPDFTYLDGRPTPLGAKKLKRLHRQQEIAKEVVRLSGEIDFAVERHRQMKLKEEDDRKKILDSKLKAKGKLLLKKNE